MSERIFPSIRTQTLFLEAQEKLRHGMTVTVVQAEEREVPPTEDMYPGETPRVLGTLPDLPPLLRATLQNQDRQLKSPHKTKIKSSLIQVLFDHLNQFTLYPSHKQYVEVLSALLTQFPFLREKTGSGYDALHESLKNKFKKERIPLVNNEEVQDMKRKFKVNGSGRKRKQPGDPVVMTRLQRPAMDDGNDLGEDERSIANHLTTMAGEVEKVRPNLDMVKDLMTKTRVHRKKFVSEHTTEVLEEFPCLTIPKLLLWDMSLVYGVDPDRMVVTNLRKMASRIIEMAPKSTLLDICVNTISLCTEESVKKGLQLNSAVLLLPTLFREDGEHIFVIEKIPDIPTPCVSLHGCEEGNPLEARRILVHMDGMQMLREDPSVDISFALSAVFSLYYVFGVQYPKGLRKSMLFLERFVFKISQDEPLPLTVRRVYNSLCD